MMKTILYEAHESLGARFTSFASYRLPLYYTSITNEHLAVRENVGLFDVSHMGRLVVEGNEAKDFLNFIAANDVEKLYPGKMHYSLLLNENAGIIDDITVFMFSETKFVVVVNASNRLKVINWLNKNKQRYRYEVSIKDITKNTIMLAVQGPNSGEIYNKIYNENLDLKRFHFKCVGVPFEKGCAIISRSGYTGEDGFEIIYFFSGKKDAFNLWREFYREVERLGGLPCGLGARDMLRIEAGYCLYGNDIDESINPFEASLEWVVKLYKSDFIGKDALLKLKDNISKKRYGLVMEAPGIPRKGYKVFCESSDSKYHEVGYVTSGGYSPILEKGIGMVYVDVKSLKEPIDKEVLIDVRGRMRKGFVKNFPLYDPKRYGYNRVIK